MSYFFTWCNLRAHNIGLHFFKSNSGFPVFTTWFNLPSPQHRSSIFFFRKKNSGFPLSTTGCNLRAPHYRVLKKNPTNTGCNLRAPQHRFSMCFPRQTNSGFPLFTTEWNLRAPQHRVLIFPRNKQIVGFQFLPLGVTYGPHTIGF